MIVDKKTGMKVAENKEESHWHKLKERLEQQIELAKFDIEVNQELIKVCEDKLK